MSAHKTAPGNGIFIQIGIIVSLAVVLCLAIGYTSLESDRAFIRTKTDEFQQNQLTTVTHLAERVQSQFGRLDDALYSLSQMPKSQFLAKHKNEAILHMIRAFRMNQSVAEGIFRVDKNCNIILAYPSKAVGPLVNDLKPIFERARMTGQSAFKVISRHGDGRDLLVIARPVYTVQGKIRLHPSNKYAGLILFVTSLSTLSKTVFYFNRPNLSEQFSVISDDSVLVSAPNPGLLGKPVLELLPKDASEGQRLRMRALVERMLKGDRGTDKYSVTHKAASAGSTTETRFELNHRPLGSPSRPNRSVSQTMLAAFTPLRVQNQNWSILVSNPKQDVTRLVDKAIGERWLNSIGLLVTIVSMTLAIVIIIKKNYHQQMVEVEESQKAVREAEEKYRTLVENASDAIVILHGHQIVYHNPAYVRLLKYEGEKFPRSFLRSVLAKQRERVAPLLLGKEGQQGRSEQLALSLVGRDGQTVSVETITRQIRFRGRVAMMMVMRDITQRLKVEAELRNAKDAAENANRTKSEFLARMSHEIRTPMNGVLGMTEMMMTTGLSERQLKFTEMIKRSGETLLRIINDILDFSKIEAGKLELETIEFDLRKTIEEVNELLAIRAQAKGIELVCNVAVGVHSAVRGDPLRLSQMLMNLVGNAIKFTEDGEIVVTMRPTRETGEHITLAFEVRDTGIGIPKAAQESIFSSFTQADGATTRRHGGTGLGLTIVKELALMMGGDVGLESEEGMGSTFWFTAKFAKSAQSAPDRKPLPNGVSLRRALIVDDSRAVRMSLRDMLSAWQVHADEADSAESALCRLREDAGCYDLLLIDQSLPAMDGTSLLQRLREMPECATLPVVMMAPVDEQGSSSTIDGSESVAWLNKPVRQSALYDCIVQILFEGVHATPTAASEQAQEEQVSQPLNAFLLLVDDNPVNQIVAEEMLDLLGCRVRTVENGLEAVEAAQEQTYDLVLMDVQMPVMDGLEATRKIRAWEAGCEPPRHTPVVALTADAMADDRQRCLRAGMDDYLSKPFTREELRSVLEANLRRREDDVPAACQTAAAPCDGRDVAAAGEEPAEVAAETAAAAESMPPRSDAAAPSGEQAEPAARPSSDGRGPSLEPVEPVIDRGPLDRLVAMRKQGGSKILLKVVGMYLKNAPSLLEEIRQAVQDPGQVDEVRRAAHSLKSASANVGATKLSKLAKKLEDLAKEGRLDGGEVLAKQMDAHFPHVRDELERMCEEAAASEQPDSHPEARQSG